MKISHFNSVMNFCNHFRSSRNLLSLSFYSTTLRPIEPIEPCNPYPLYRKIFPIGDPNVSIVPVLDQSIEDGRIVEKSDLLFLIKELRNFRRYKHALEISMWMSDKRYYRHYNHHVAAQLDLIAKVHGIEQAEKYFNNIPRQFKAIATFNAVLNCYVHAGLVEKAEAVMQQMKDLGFARSSKPYNLLLKLYYKTGCYEKMDAILHEMEKEGIRPDRFTYGTQISASVANSDVEGIDKILTRVETDPEALDWCIYSNAANGYIKAGLVDKALLMLKKSELTLEKSEEQIMSAQKKEQILTALEKDEAFQCILTQYATIGKKDEVLRIWEVYKNQQDVYNAGYICVISCLLKFDDIEGAEKIFKEWESKNLNSDSHVPNCLQNFAGCLVYLKGKGELEGAEEMIRLAADKGWVCADTQERLLNYIKGEESNTEAPLEILGFAVDGRNEETSRLLAADKDDVSTQIMPEKLIALLGFKRLLQFLGLSN